MAQLITLICFATMMPHSFLDDRWTWMMQGRRNRKVGDFSVWHCFGSTVCFYFSTVSMLSTVPLSGMYTVHHSDGKASAIARTGGECGWTLRASVCNCTPRYFISHYSPSLIPLFGLTPGALRLAGGGGWTFWASVCNRASRICTSCSLSSTATVGDSHGRRLRFSLMHCLPRFKARSNAVSVEA